MSGPQLCQKYYVNMLSFVTGVILLLFKFIITDIYWKKCPYINENLQNDVLRPPFVKMLFLPPE